LEDTTVATSESEPGLEEDYDTEDERSEEMEEITEGLIDDFDELDILSWTYYGHISKHSYDVSLVDDR
jgi:hypothetical protein